MGRPKKVQVEAEVAETPKEQESVVEVVNESVQESLPVKPVQVAHGESGNRQSIHDIMRGKFGLGYSTTDPDEYAKLLSRMNLSDLQTHAVDRGIRPTGDRRRVETTLLKEFLRVIAKQKINESRGKPTPESKEKEEKMRRSSERMNSWFRGIR